MVNILKSRNSEKPCYLIYVYCLYVYIVIQVYKLQKGYTLHKGDLHKPLKNWNTGLVGASQLEDI